MLIYGKQEQWKVGMEDKDKDVVIFNPGCEEPGAETPTWNCGEMAVKEPGISSAQPCSKVGAMVMVTIRVALCNVVIVENGDADWWWSSMMISILNTTKTQTYEKWAFTFQGSQIIYAWAMDAKSLELPEGVGLVGLACATT